MSFSDKAAIVGIGETEYVKGSERTAVDLMLRRPARPSPTGLKPSQIDGMVPPPIYTPPRSCRQSGASMLRYASTVHMGGDPTTAL